MSPLTLAQLIAKQQTTQALIDLNKSKRIKRKPKKEEHNIQIQIVQYLRYQGYLVFAIPNGGSRNAIEGANLKKEGVMAGVADLQVILNNGKSLFLEVKTDKGKQSQSQIDFESKIKELGHDYYVVRTIDDAIEVIQICEDKQKLIDLCREYKKSKPKIDKKIKTKASKQTQKTFKICKICHTPTPAEEVGEDGACIIPLY